MSNQNVTAENELRAIIDEWAEYVRKPDIDSIIKFYAPDVVAYDAILKLQFVGRDAYIKHWKYCMEMCPPGTMIFDIKDLKIVADQNVAFSYFLNRCGKIEDGKEKASWMRVTRCYQKIEDTWLTVHEHFSSPFNMETGKALFDAQP